MFDLDNVKICVVGLGYVGLPLAVEFSKKYDVIGFDVKKDRVSELKQGVDRTLEVEKEELLSVDMEYTNSVDDIKSANVYIVTVPTPIDDYKNPDLKPLMSASKTVGAVLNIGDVVVYESTVYPGCTEEVCMPILEKESGFKFNKDFFVGYSPERINPGDKEHKVSAIKKVVSGSTDEVADMLNSLYASIIKVGTHRASSIKVAEAAKVIENTQRDINIAFVNELALIFDKMGIDTHEVLDAAGTKWNFLKFKPGLVGGHCIGVDPYYLTYKAKQIGYHPEIILAGRRTNDNMGVFVANQVVKLMIKKGHTIKGSRVLVLGITFKENCPDIRNSRVIDVIREFQEFGINFDVHDPWADPEEVKLEYNIDLLQITNNELPITNYNGIVLAVAHDEFRELEEKLTNLRKTPSARSQVIYDIKGFFDRKLIDGRL